MVIERPLSSLCSSSYVKCGVQANQHWIVVSARKRTPEASGGAMHSQFFESPFSLLLVGLPHQEIEPSSLRVIFDLLVPAFPFLFRQPPEKLGDLLAGKPLDICLEFINLGHCVSLPSLGRQG